jgi:hypothetical protein
VRANRPLNRCVRTVAIVLIITSQQARAQEKTPDPEFRDIGPTVLRAISPLLIPKVMGDCALLRDFIRSEEFAEVRRRSGDLHSVDVIFDEALRLSWNNVYEALLISALGTLDHHRVGVCLPVLCSVHVVPPSVVCTIVP